MKTRRRRGWIDLALFGVMSVPAFVLSNVRPTLGIVPGVLFCAAALVLWFRPRVLGAHVSRKLGQKTVPADQQALFGAHDRMLREAVAWLDSTRVPLKGIGSRMLMLLASRIVQLGAAVQSLCEGGHAGEAAPTARAMVSACVTLIYIAEEPDNRAAAYMQTEQFKRKYRIARIHEEQAKAEAAGTRLIVSPEELVEIDQKDPELTAVEDKRLALLANNGVVPTRLGARQDVVSGLSESKLFDQMNAMHWYLSYYALFSDEIHVSANALYTELVEQMSGQSLIGAKFENPLHVLLASREMVINAMEQIDRAFNLNQRGKLEAIDGPIRAALAAYRDAQKPATPVA